MLKLLFKRTVNDIALKLLKDKQMREKFKNTALKSYRNIKESKSSEEVMKQLGKKVGNLKSKIKDL